MSLLAAEPNRSPACYSPVSSLAQRPDLQAPALTYDLAGTVLDERRISDTRRVLSEIGIADVFSDLSQKVMSDYEEALNPSESSQAGGPPPIYPRLQSEVEKEIEKNPDLDPHSAKTRLKKLSRVMVLAENKRSLMTLFESKNEYLVTQYKSFMGACDQTFPFLVLSEHYVSFDHNQLNQPDIAIVFSSQLFNALVKNHFGNAYYFDQYYYNDKNWKELVKYIREDLNSPHIAESLEDSFENKMNLMDECKG